MTVSQVHEALGAFSIKLKPNIPRDVLDQIEYFGHLAVIPGRMDARTYGDGTLDAARYVGVVRKKKVADTTSSSTGNANQAETSETSVTLEGVGMNFWLGDEEDKGSIIEDSIQFTSSNFSTAISGLLPPSVTMGTVGGVSGTYSGVHQWQTPRKAIQYVCDTMSQPPNPSDLISDANASFETSGGVGGWTAASNCNIAVTGAYSYLGTQSMQVTPSSIGAMTAKTNGNTNAASVTEGLTYVCYFWVLPTGASTSARVGVDYRTSGGTLVGSASTDTWLTLPQNAWTQVSRTVVVPTGSSITKADFLVNLTSTASGDKFYVDNVWVYTSVPATPTSFRVNNRGTIDAGPETNLFVTTPKCLLVRQGSLQGEDLSIKAVPGSLGLDQDMEDFATRVVILGGSDGFQFSVGRSDIGTVSPGVNVYKDIHGNPLQLTKMVSESQTSDTNADTRAELALRDIITLHRELTLNTNDYDIYGSFEIGDHVYVYDPDSNLIDTANETIVRGVRVNPIKLQVTETEWAVTDEYSIAYRANDGTWYDLTDYLEPEAIRATKVVVGDFKRTLDSSLQNVTSRLGTNGAPDNITPGQVSWVVGSFQTVDYLDSGGIAKAQQKVAWTLPLNVDLSDITDGAFYEVQYKLNTGHLYSQTWGAVSTLHWNQLSTWAQPVQASTVDWETRVVQWGTYALILNDLAVGTAYDFRIRAVDKSNNQGTWSSVETVITAEDNIPPSQPAAPDVASSLIAVQVTHSLGKSSGGTFNLESDLAYFEVHAQYEPNFVPVASTKLGNLIANVSMLQAQTPAVATFSISSTAAVYVKVVAVDRSGNRSSPSVAQQASATLIDDAHISGLTVSKITAGEITADWILSGSIKTGVDGARMETDFAGLRAYDTDNIQTFNLSSVDGSIDMKGSAESLNYVEGLTGWRIGPDGSTQFENLNVLNTIGAGDGYFNNVFMNGSLLPTFTDLNNYYQVPAPETRVRQTSGVSTSSTSTTWTRIDWSTYDYVVNTGASDFWSISAPSRFYAPISGVFELNFNLVWDTNGNAIQTEVVCEKNAGGDATQGTVLLDNFDSAPANMKTTNTGSFTTYLDAGEYVEFFARSTGGSVSLNVGNTGTSLCQIRYKAKAQTWAGSGAQPAVKNLSYTCNATRTYIDPGYGNGLRDEYTDTRCYQGYFDSNWGQQKSQVYFPSNIAADLAGKNVTNVTLYFTIQHGYNGYLQTVIGTHNNGSIQSTWPGTGVSSNQFQLFGYAGGRYSLTMGQAMAERFQSDTVKGIVFGPSPSNSTSQDYYGYIYGEGSGGDEPTLIFEYVE